MPCELRADRMQGAGQYGRPGRWVSVQLQQPPGAALSPKAIQDQLTSLA